MLLGVEEGTVVGVTLGCLLALGATEGATDRLGLEVGEELTDGCREGFELWLGF